MQEALACVISKHASYKTSHVHFVLETFNSTKIKLYISKDETEDTEALCAQSSWTSQSQFVVVVSYQKGMLASSFVETTKRDKGFGYSFFSWLKSAVEQVF